MRHIVALDETRETAKQEVADAPCEASRNFAASAIIPRSIAADYALVSIRTLQRAEKKGYLTPIRRGRQGIAYKREELLRLVGIIK